MSSEDLEKYETEMELQLYREYRDVVGLFTHVVETERRFYLANSVDLKVRSEGGEVYFDVTMSDAWVWDVYRPARFVKTVRVLPKEGGFQAHPQGVAPWPHSPQDRSAVCAVGRSVATVGHGGGQGDQFSPRCGDRGEGGRGQCSWCLWRTARGAVSHGVRHAH